jgi:hypothetical protein
MAYVVDARGSNLMILGSGRYCHIIVFLVMIKQILSFYLFALVH